ncbi:pimeloyl-ACP methyl ester carboxylesterase [Saccharothrix coeruleofusca]|uniref:alpha/beta fold hydrolase n=1 Tax=Saccharothrix coeruleofusca TaxID=33919 RepID=UPI001AE77EBC|nr:alpha/beta hydrolase [Saccharothrix coeruleofusca]MBP2334737.1 pimeloyl-ACP methyl ester carboxylesterase [Saccharothrix coeruleofusca]
MQDRYVTRAGAKIAYEITGSGPVLGYAHGVFLSRAAVRRLHLLDFDALAAGRRLLTYDQRGHGHSTGRPIADDYRFENFTLDLLALLDELDVDEPIDFMGSSLGCDVALRAAITAPDRFRRLVLIIPPVAWEEGPGQARRWYTDSAEAIESSGPARWRREWAQQPPLPIFADYPAFTLAPDIPDELLAPILRGIGESDLPAQDAIAALSQPALILTWDTDPLHPVSTAQRLHELLADSTLHVSSTVADVQTWSHRITEFLVR